jgi:hypothetical protein
MATSTTTGRDIDRFVGALAPATGAPLLLDVRVSRRGRAAEVTASPAGDPVGAFRQRIRLAGVSEPDVLDAIVDDLGHGRVGFEVTVDGQRREATLAAVDAGVVRLTITDLATLTVVFEDDDQEPTGQGVAGADDFAILVILAIVMTVGAVGSLIVIVSNTEGECEVEGEGKPPEPDPGGGSRR